MLAAKRLGQAQKLAPQNGQLHYLSGVLESKRGNPSQAIVELRKAVQINPHDLRAMYLLAQEIERQGDANGEAEFQQLLEKILAAQPDNPAALLELGRVAAKRGDAQTLHSVVAQPERARSNLAPGSATAMDRFADCGRRPRSASSRRSHRIPAQLAHAPTGFSSKPEPDTAHRRERGHPLHPLPAAALANVYSAAGRYGDHLPTRVDGRSSH